MKLEEKYAVLSLAIDPKFKFNQYRKILKRYGSVSEFLSKRKTERYKTLPGFEPAELNTDKISSEFIIYGEDVYPNNLAQIPAPPIYLFYRGDISLSNSENLVSIVGTRAHTNYGKKVTEELVTALSGHGCQFVSGMALGIDAIVHSQALLNKSKTIAVLPSTLENPRPRSNYKLFEEISETGLVLSEFFSEDGWGKFVYARRNRIIAGLSPATIVTEAPLKSGALITATLAFDYNRDVYAVPGGVYTEKSAGCNWLIKTNKAQLLTDSTDLFPEQLKLTGFRESSELTQAEKLVLEALETEPRVIDDLASCVNMSPRELNQTLLELELKKLICLNSSGKYMMSFS